MKNKNGFFKLEGQVAFALIAFFAISLFAFLPFCVNSMTLGISNSVWILSFVSLAVPIFCIITGYISERKKIKVEQGD